MKYLNSSCLAGGCSGRLFTYEKETMEELMPSRDPEGNKGTFGKVLCIAGSVNMCGAALFCGKAALRMGAGMVRIFTREENRVIVQTAFPEALLSTYEVVKNASDCSTGREDTSGTEIQLRRKLAESLNWCDTITIGSGLGRDATAAYLVRILPSLISERSHIGSTGSEHRFRGLVIDGDAIRLIRCQNLYEAYSRAAESVPVVFTPHMAECADLLQTDMNTLRRNRARMIKSFADRMNCTIMCKDARTVIVSDFSDDTYINTSGNDGLATAGSGDVLCGMCAGILAQQAAPFEAACTAAFLHGRLAQLLSQSQSRASICASDLVEAIRLLR